MKRFAIAAASIALVIGCTSVYVPGAPLGSSTLSSVYIQIGKMLLGLL